MNTIEDYNNELINKLIKIDFLEYFKYVHNNFYKNIDISFINYLLEINNSNNFIIGHEKLKEYKVINDIHTSNHILRCLKQYNLIENIDYKVFEQISSINSNIKKQYKLTPTAFKLCLIRAKNSKIYANYYLLLEKVFNYYNKYQTNLQKYLLTLKDDKIDEQSKKIDEQSKKIDELLGYSKDIIIQKSYTKLSFIK